MKKRASKPKKYTPKPTTVSDECKEYREQISEYVCEVESYLRRDPDSAKFIEDAIEASYQNKRMQIHHIFGRSRHVESNWFCSLIQVSTAAHLCGHDRKPYAFEICCLASKLDRHERHRDLQEVGIYSSDTPIERLHWFDPAMSKVCGCVSIVGRLEGLLLPNEYVRGTVFEAIGIDVLERLKRGCGK